MFTQGYGLMLDRLVELFAQRHGAAALPVGPGEAVKSAEFLQCTPVQVGAPAGARRPLPATAFCCCRAPIRAGTRRPPPRRVTSCAPCPLPAARPPRQVSADLLAVLRASRLCPSERELLRRQVARLADPATDYDFGAGGAQVGGWAGRRPHSGWVGGTRAAFLVGGWMQMVLSLPQSVAALRSCAAQTSECPPSCPRPPAP